MLAVWNHAAITWQKVQNRKARRGKDVASSGVSGKRNMFLMRVI